MEQDPPMWDSLWRTPLGSSGLPIKLTSGWIGEIPLDTPEEGFRDLCKALNDASWNTTKQGRAKHSSTKWKPKSGQVVEELDLLVESMGKQDARTMLKLALWCLYAQSEGGQ